MYKKGDKILYNNTEKGIVKIDQTDNDFIFAVFNCGNDWNNFENYTGQRTPINKISKGWSLYGTREFCKENGGCTYIQDKSKWSEEGQSVCVDCGCKN